MPSSAEVYQSLRMIGASCKGMGSGENWATGCATLWAQELGFATRDDVVEGARRWVRSEDKRPSLSEFLTLVNSIRKQGDRDDGIKGCDDCGNSGWREIVAHLKAERGEGRVVEAVTAPCICPRGRHFARSTKGNTVTEAVRDYRNSSRLIEIHVTDRDRLAIPLANRVSPEQYQEMMKRPRRKGHGFDRVLSEFGGDK